jgi:hypothetical protein
MNFENLSHHGTNVGAGSPKAEFGTIYTYENMVYAESLETYMYIYILYIYTFVKLKLGWFLSCSVVAFEPDYWDVLAWGLGPLYGCMAYY